MRSLARLRELDAAELRVLAGAVVLLGVVPLVLRVGGLRGARSVMDRFAPGSPVAAGGSPSPIPRQTARLLDIAARRGPFRPACLARSLALQWMLRRRGFQADLRIGVRKAEQGFEAHAWVEHDGTPLGESANVVDRYAPMEPGPFQ